MKCNSNNVGAEKSWRQIIETMEDNVIITLQVLHEDFGFGEERMNRLLDAILDKAQEFQQAVDDDVLDLKTNYEREHYHDKIHELIKTKAVGFLPTGIYNWFYNTPLPSVSSVRREDKAKARRKNHVSLKEATELQQKMLAAKRYAEHIVSEANRNI